MNSGSEKLRVSIPTINSTKRYSRSREHTRALYRALTLRFYQFKIGMVLFRKLRASSILMRTYCHSTRTLCHYPPSRLLFAPFPFSRLIKMHAQDSSTWTSPDDITLTDLTSQLAASGVHPLFLVTDESLDAQYQALVGEIGFGAAESIDAADALASNYNADYLPRALMDGLEVRVILAPVRRNGGGVRGGVISLFYCARGVTLDINTKNKSA